MDIILYSGNMAGDVASLFNEVTQRVPHCYPVMPETFHSRHLEFDLGGPGSHRLEDQEVMVATDGGQVRGFVAVAVESASESTPGRQGVIRFLSYQRGHKEVGSALLNRAESYLRERNLGKVVVFHQATGFRSTI